ncbi:hypothetical protein PQZ38_02635 [Pelagibacteraceae bacterium]|nr:hypothetical protein [Pelagibacteraceae bacterium]
MNKLNQKQQFYIYPICLILILSLSRIIPHPANFTPILALGIFSGFYFKNLIISFFVVISSMFLGDLYLGFHGTMFFTYTSLALAVLIGFFIKYFKFKEILVSGLAASTIFFLITSFGSWLTHEMYEKSFSGLLQAYAMGIPFFLNTLISTFFYLALLKFLFNFAINKKMFKFSF